LARRRTGLHITAPTKRQTVPTNLAIHHLATW
jgi:hypothetical protein